MYFVVKKSASIPCSSVVVAKPNRRFSLPKKNQAISKNG